MTKDSWPSDLELAMREANVVGPPPPVDPPMPPKRPGDRITHLGGHEYTLLGYSNTQPFTHVWNCTVPTTYGLDICSERKTRTCTKFANRYEPCRCFENEKEEADGLE